MTENSMNPLIEGKVSKQQYEVGERVEVFCDHDEDGNRVRGWLDGVVVQAEEKRVAVQFVQDVYLTNGWMVPDRVLWCAHGSSNIRPATRRTRRRSKSRKR